MAVLHQSGGVIVRRVLDPSDTEIPTHAHDWPVLSVHVLGGYLNETELGQRLIEGPSAVLYDARCPHRNRSLSFGFEQIEIEFDRDWLGVTPVGRTPVTHWVGGHGGLLARSLARYCAGNISDSGLRSILHRILEVAGDDRRPKRAPWVADISRRLRSDASLGARELSGITGLHASWLGRAFRQGAGEGLREAATRSRVERASKLLRETDRPQVEVALDAGFCDQSHMSRSFRRLLGRRPTDIRNDRYTSMRTSGR